MNFIFNNKDALTDFLMIQTSWTSLILQLTSYYQTHYVWANKLPQKSCVTLLTQEIPTKPSTTKTHKKSVISFWKPQQNQQKVEKSLNEPLFFLD